MNLSITVKILKTFEYLAKYRCYRSFVEYAVFAIRRSRFVFYNIQQRATFQ